MRGQTAADHVGHLPDPLGRVNDFSTRLENKIIDPGDEVGRNEGDVDCRERMGGLLNYYYHRAA